MELTTGKQTHRIKRLLFELNIEQQAQAQRLHSEVSQICHRRIAPLLERCLGEVAADRLFRIDSLELDLGTIDPANLEAEVLVQLEQQIRRVLPSQLRHGQGSDQYGADARIQSRLELLAIYASKGYLPWWANHTQAEPLSEALGVLLLEAPAALAELMQTLSKDRRALARIIRRCDDGMLSQLGGCLCAPQAQVMKRFSAGLISLLHAVARHGAATSTVSSMVHPRQLVWRALLYTAAATSTRPTVTTAFWREVLLQLAILKQARYDALLYDLHACLERAGVDNVPEPLGELLTTLNRELPATGSHTNSAQTVLSEEQSKSHIAGSRAPDWSTVVHLLERLAVRNGQLTEAALRNLTDALVYAGLAPPGRLRQRLREFKPRLRALLPPTQVSKLDTLLSASQTKPSASTGQDDTGVTGHPREKRLHESETSLRERLTPERMRELEALLQVSRKEQLRPPEAEPLIGKIEKANINSLFSASDEAYVENAGLVILWPFLERFFARLDLLHEKRFRDAAAAQRAVALLQYLATEDADGPEYLLPLNKVLCGMEPDELFDFAPLQENESEECRQLLEAVIEHASILRKMSVAGFRGSFLLRKGLLESRDGSWLLRVEKESYDVVLDRFPWSFSWLRLPWMKTPLRVEW